MDKSKLIQNVPGVLTPSQVVAAVAKSDGFNADASTGQFAREATREIISEIYRHEYPATKWANGDLISFRGGNPGAEEYSYSERASVGRAAIISGGGDDIPYATHEGVRTLRGIVSIAIGVSFTLQDLRAAAMQGNYSHLQELAQDAREAHDRTLDGLIQNGEANADLYGAANAPGTRVIEATTTDWTATTTGSDIVDEFRALINAPSDESDGVEMSDTILMPVDIWNLLQSKVHLPAASDRTVMDFLKTSFPQIKKWDWVPALKTGADDGGKAILAYRNDPRYLCAKMPLKMAPVPPQRENLKIKLLFETRFGGVMVPRPRSITRLVSV